MVGRVFSILFYVPAGAFVTWACLTFFVAAAYNSHRIETAGMIICFPMATTMLIGLACSRFADSTRDLGVVLVSGAGTSIAVVLLLTCLQMGYATELRARRQTIVLTDYLLGFAVSAIVIATGVLMIRASRNASRTRKQPAASKEVRQRW